MTSASLPAEQTGRQELAAFLKTRRSELQPEDFGIPRRGRRRVTGLRRHEVADLAAVSVTWYTWLEQGRDIRVSPAMLDAVARALRLDDDAWRYVRSLAGAPVVDRTSPHFVVDSHLLELLTDLMPTPASLMTVCFDVVAWNSAYVFLNGDPALVPEHERNAVSMFFCGDTWRSRIEDWEDEVDGVVAQFRAEAAKYPDDPRFPELVSGLMTRSPEFAAAWHRQHVRRYSDQIVRLNHPDAGRLRIRVLRMRLLDQSGLTLLLYRPVDAETSHALSEAVRSITSS